MGMFIIMHAGYFMCTKCGSIYITQPTGLALYYNNYVYELHYTSSAPQLITLVQDLTYSTNLKLIFVIKCNSRSLFSYKIMGKCARCTQIECAKRT